MKNVFIYEDGQKVGEVFADTNFISEKLAKRDVIYFPLLSDITLMKPSIDNEVPDMTIAKTLRCRKTEMIVKDKRVWLCKEE